MINNPLLENTPENYYRKELKVKQSIYMSIYIIYEIFLLIFAICIVHTVATRDDGCGKYVPYLLLTLFGNISYIFSCMMNLYNCFKPHITAWVHKASWFFLLLGIAFKLAFIIYSIVIYDRAYGDCYLPYQTQLIFMIGSFLEMIFLVFLHNFWISNEKMLKG